MPKKVVARARRAEFVDAAWRVIRRDGLPAASLRRVAAEANCTTGALTHYYSNREALLVDALRSAHFAAGARMVDAARASKGDMKRLEAVLLEVLPLDDVRMQEWRTHLTFWGEACDNKKLRRENALRFREWSDLLTRYLSPLVPRSEAKREAMILIALIDGLALRLVLKSGEPGDSSTEIVEAVRAYLRAMRFRYR